MWTRWERLGGGAGVVYHTLNTSTEESGNGDVRIGESVLAFDFEV